MKIEIDICSGSTGFGMPTKADIQKNIDALQRMLDGKSLALDFVLLVDTKSILVGIQAKLPE